MNRFTHFTSNGMDCWLDVAKVAGVQRPCKETRKSGLFSKASIVWVVYFFYESGYQGHLVCWCEELANNYCKMLRGVGK